MSLFAIGDFHLSFNSEKPMDIFGKAWENHTEKLNQGFQLVKDSDLTVICGDISWGMGTKNCIEDFDFIEKLPGKKIILKGNHDYWWTTMSKIKSFLTENNFSSIDILHNNSFEYDDISICGTRGWQEGELDEKILNRELGRLKFSLDSAKNKEKLVFLHYPPCDEFLELFREYDVRHCYYGHIHGQSIKYAYNGWKNGCELKLVSADALNFTPLNIR